MHHSFIHHSTRRLLTTSVPKLKPKVHFLDLKNSGLSAIERLCLEEALLRHDPLHRNWAIVGTHDPTYQQFLSLNKNRDDLIYYENCIIVMGIGGKPDELLNLEKVREDNVLVVKRFSGGGTVVLDHHSLWTSFIGRTVDFPHVEPFPRSIMSWSASSIFERVFDRMKTESLSSSQTLKTLMIDTKSCGLADQTRKSMVVDSKISKDLMDIPNFHLKENDYVLGEKKIGGNAQSIVKGGWLHHTSFLWDFDQEHMSYLSLPKKQPEYRNNRNHDDFLAKLKVYSANTTTTETKAKQAFFEHIRDVCSESFDLHHASLDDAMEVINLKGGIEKWFEDGCRTRVIDV